MTVSLAPPANISLTAASAGAFGMATIPTLQRSARDTPAATR
jgi:hypothetical protein